MPPCRLWRHQHPCTGAVYREAGGRGPAGAGEGRGGGAGAELRGGGLWERGGAACAATTLLLRWPWQGWAVSDNRAGRVLHALRADGRRSRFRIQKSWGGAAPAAIPISKKLGARGAGRDSDFKKKLGGRGGGLK